MGLPVVKKRTVWQFRQSGSPRSIHSQWTSKMQCVRTKPTKPVVDTGWPFLLFSQMCLAVPATSLHSFWWRSVGYTALYLVFCTHNHLISHYCSTLACEDFSVTFRSAGAAVGKREKETPLIFISSTNVDYALALKHEVVLLISLSTMSPNEKTDISL